MSKAVDDYLAALPSETLIKIITDQASSSGQFMNRLTSAAQLASGETPNLAEWKKRVTAAYGSGFVDWMGAADWHQDVMDVLETVSDLNDAGHHETAMILAEHAHKRTETAVKRVDDSDGLITDIFHEIATIHTDACLAGAASGKKLARRLVKLELSAELDTFHRSAVSHAEALGEDGIAEYGRLVARAADQLHPGDSMYGPAIRVRHAQLAHAIASGDPDRLVDLIVVHREASGERFNRHGSLVSTDYLEIADALTANGRSAEALEWLTRGTTELDSWSMGVDKVRERRAEMLRAEGDDEEIARMYWAAFEESPKTLSYLDALRTAAVKDTARSEAAAYVLGLLGEPGEHIVGRQLQDAKVIGVVEVLMVADRLDEAWDVACQYGTPLRLWDDLAEVRKSSNLDDAVTVWMLRVGEQIEKGQKKYYRKAARLLKSIKMECESAGRLELYQSHVDGIRAKHSNWPSLLRELADS